MYEIRFTSAAERFLRKLREQGLKAAFKKGLEAIAENPYIGEQKKGNLRGVYGYDVYYRSVNCEIAYRIYEEDGRAVLVILMGARENFYERLGKLL